MTVYFYAFAPIASTLFFGYMAIQFWTDKYMTLRRNKKIRRLDSILACQVADSLQSAITAMLLIYLFLSILRGYNEKSRKNHSILKDLFAILLIILNMRISLRSYSV